MISDVEFDQPSVHRPVLTAYDAWKDFHRQLRTRLDGLALLAYIQDPDSLVEKMNAADQQVLMQREGIRVAATYSDYTLYDGALQYFTTQAGAPIVDGIVRMWYMRSLDKCQTLLSHDIAELASFPGSTPSLIGGIKILMQDSNGTWCTTDCLQTPQDYATVVAENTANAVGTSVFMWPFATTWGNS